jgi:hypothetical protein
LRETQPIHPSVGSWHQDWSCDDFIRIGFDHAGFSQTQRVELFASQNIRSIASLKGKTIGVPDFGTSPQVFLSTMAAHVGLDPAKDINWITSPTVAPKDLFVDA